MVRNLFVKVGLPPLLPPWQGEFGHQLILP